MKKNYYLLLLTVLISVCSTAVKAQMSGAAIFLPGHYLEIGQDGNGAFGPACGLAGYYPHTGWGTNLAEVYDYGHDGWTVGSPQYMGDYTYPGSPFEGWEMQVNGVRTQAFYGSGFSGGGSLTGTNTSYVNAGGRLLANWTGTNAGLQINQESRVDTNEDAVVVTTIFHNTSGAPVSNVYYLRSCDPDNDESWPSGSFTTNNQLDYQNDVSDHRVMVTATGTGYSFATLSLGTKDCRAVGFIYSSWPLSSTVDLATCWNMTYTGGWGGTYYDYRVNHTGDIAIGLVYNLGTIAAGDSAVISYAYIFNSNNYGIDSAFPDPQMVVNGVIVDSIDTFNLMYYPGMTTIPVDIIHATDKCWTWSHWTWSPGTALATTVGVSNIITVSSLLADTTTFTITGTDSAFGMQSCQNKIFRLTIILGFGATSNGPCVGDTIKLHAVGDTTGATFYWTGPGGFTSTLTNPIIYPASLSDTGRYVIHRTTSAHFDSGSTYVHVYTPNPLVLASNAPLCAGFVDTLHLTAGPDSVGETFLWSGPSGFSSTMENPNINPFLIPDTGIYRAIATTIHGCKDTAYTYVSLAEVPHAPVLYGRTTYCACDAFVPILDSGIVAGGSLLWYPSGTGGTSSTIAPLVNTCIPGTYRFWASQIVGSCEGPRDSITIVVHHTPAAPIVTYNAEYCQYDPFVPIVATPAGTGVIYWYTVPVGGSPSTTAPTVNTAIANTYTFYASQIDSGCESPRTAFTIIVHPKPAAPSVTPPAYCQFDIPSSLVTSISGVLPGANVTWYVGTSSTGLSIAPTPSTALPGIDSYYVKQTSVYGCKSDSVLDPVTIHPQPAAPVTTDTSYCQGSPSFPLTVDAVATDGNTLTWYTSLYGAGATTTAPIPPTTIVGTTTWYVSQTTSFGCISPKSPITVTTLYLPVFTISQSNTFACQDSTMTLTYTGANLTQGAYTWILPSGASLVNGSTLTSPSITVRFDSLYNNLVYLTSSDYNGRCATSDTIEIRVVPMPVARTFITPVVCVGDTVGLALSYRSENGYSFVWDFAFGTSGTDGQIIAANSNSGGPYSASWNSGGVKVVTVTPYTVEGCKGNLVYDSVHVRDLPDATYGWLTHNQSLGSSNELCSDDTVQFVAHTDSANFSYTWEPAHFFRENNGSIIFGIVQVSGDITLNVIDPYGCKNSVSSYFKVDGCCTVTMPNAFSPNGDGKNDYFRPVYEGYHRFHIFRVENRWGQTVFESTNNRMEWDGTYGGVPQDIGVYYYYLQYDCGDQKGIIKRGDFTLVR